MKAFHLLDKVECKQSKDIIRYANWSSMYQTLFTGCSVYSLLASV